MGLFKDLDRPYTGAADFNEHPSKIITTRTTNKRNDQLIFGGSHLELILLSNWGNKNMIGLTGFEIVDDMENVIQISPDLLKCNINNELFDLGRLVNGENLTVDPNDMWCVPYEYDQDTIVSIHFESFTYISGIFSK